MGTIRALIRLAGLGGIILWGCGLRILAPHRWRGRESDVRWMQWMSRHFLQLLACDFEVRGQVPGKGLVVCNHLGYLDILVLGAVCPAVFVAKNEVRAWPVFGMLARMAGTLFIERGNRFAVRAQLSGLAEILAADGLAVLFPEGTSSDGSKVLPFHSSLLEAAQMAGSRIAPAALTYRLEGEGEAGELICYWGEMNFAAHLLRLLSVKRCRATLSFTELCPDLPGRRQKAVWLHSRISEELTAIKENSGWRCLDETQTTVC